MQEFMYQQAGPVSQQISRALPPVTPLVTAALLLQWRYACCCNGVMHAAAAAAAAAASHSGGGCLPANAAAAPHHNNGALADGLVMCYSCDCCTPLLPHAAPSLLPLVLLLLLHADAVASLQLLLTVDVVLQHHWHVIC
jgi:hypothetical protein